MEWYEEHLQDFGDYEEGEVEERPRDRKIDEAKGEILALVEENPRSIYYIKQLQVLFEKVFFHWITGYAIGELIDEGVIGVEEAVLTKGSVKFVFHRGHRRRKRQITRAVKVIEAYSKPEIGRACGQQAENLFLLGLAEHKFTVVARNTGEYGGRVWPSTAHTMDFIVERDGDAYGAEVKNTWDYIPRGELDVKLRMCDFLQIRPLFIVGAAPKTYIYEINQHGGYGMVFVAHIFPMGQDRLVEDIRKTFGLPCDSPRRIPDGILERFVGWHEA